MNREFCYTSTADYAYSASFICYTVDPEDQVEMRDQVSFSVLP